MERDYLENDELSCREIVFSRESEIFWESREWLWTHDGWNGIYKVTVRLLLVGRF